MIQISHTLDKFMIQLRQLRPTLRDSLSDCTNISADIILKEIASYFPNGPGGVYGWADLKESTIALKKSIGMNNGILVRTGDLKGSFRKQKLGKYSCKVGTGIDYFKYHENSRPGSRMFRPSLKPAAQYTLRKQEEEIEKFLVSTIKDVFK